MEGYNTRLLPSVEALAQLVVAIVEANADVGAPTTLAVGAESQHGGRAHIIALVGEHPTPQRR
eukprot:COSAG01_NODE_67868_length_265_cov_3.018072_1_plen_62_part_10